MSERYSIRMERLTKYYNGFLALSDFSLDVEKNRTIALLGPNGAGKTTLMKILCGLIMPTSGRATICGFDVVSERESAVSSVGAIINNPEFYPYLTPDEMLRYLGRLRGMDEKRTGGRIDQVLSMVGLEGWKNVRTEKFSMGMKQRLALAQALLHDPKVLILDEPSLGLDPRGMMEFRQIIKKLKGKKTVFLATHLISEVVQVCELVAIIDRGKLKAFDSIGGLKRRYRTLERAYLKLTEAIL